MSSPEAPRALFLHQGAFSHTNEQLLAALRRARPTVVFEEVDLHALIRRDGVAVLSAMVGAVATHGMAALRSRVAFREGFSRNPMYLRNVSAILRRRLDGRRYVCTIQTQSLFNGASGTTPNYVYTDHVALARREADCGAEKVSDAWIAAERAIYRDAAHVFTFGSRIERMLIQGYGVPADRVSRIGCGASSMPTSPPSRDLIRYARRRILFVGVDWVRKGGADLLRAFDLLRARLPDVTLDIVGCDPAEARERPGVTVHGRLPLAQVEDRYREASCFCMPTRNEPFGVVFVEAAHFALPAVGTTVGDIGDVVRDGENGWRVPPRDPAALADALHRVLETPETAQRMGAAAAAIASDWTWDAVAARILARTPLATPV